MAVDEMLIRVRRTLEETYGVDGAAYLMDRPSGGWDALATKGDLDRFATKEDLELFELRFRTELRAELQAITRWCSTLVISALTVSIAAMAAIGVALRFA